MIFYLILIFNLEQNSQIMNKKILISLLVFSFHGFSQQVKVQTEVGLISMENPDLCTGRHWTEAEGKKMLDTFSNQWNDQFSWEERADIIKKTILKGIQWDKMSQISGNFNPIISPKKIMDGYSVENIAIESFPGFYITGNLYRPLKSEGKSPAILTPHGHLANKRFTDYVQIRSAFMARMGAVVFAYDMVGYGESNQINHKMPIALLLQTWNSKRVLDYLTALPEVDEEQVGMTGASGGGTQTFILTAIDPRIKVAIPVVQVSTHFFGGCVCESGMPIHKSEFHQTNNVEIAALTAPRPLLLISDGDDWTRNVDKVEFPYIQKVYEAYGKAENVENVHLALEKHDYGYSKRKAAYLFFEKHLDLSVKNIPGKVPLDESFIKILDRKALEVFNSDTPRPHNAIIGDLPLMSYLKIKSSLTKADF